MLVSRCTHTHTGGHLNPAVTVGQAVLGNHPWKKVPHYLLGQYLGGFVASAVVYLTLVSDVLVRLFMMTKAATCFLPSLSNSYFDALSAFDGGIRMAAGSELATGQVFATYPSEWLTIGGAFVDQVVGTAILLFAILAVADPRGQKIPAWLLPMYM